MTLPLTTTSVTIQRPADGVDPYEDQGLTVVATGVRGVVSGSAGGGIDRGGAQEVLTATLYVEQEADVKHYDIITDETSGQRWRAQWMRERYELGLGHKVVGLEAVAGAADG